MVELVRRESGIIVDKALEAEPDAETPGRAPVAFDADGRRRVVFSKKQQGRFDEMITDLRERGLGIVVACMFRPDTTAPCGQPLMMEQKGMPDAGYGCKCTRVHFL